MEKLARKKILVTAGVLALALVVALLLATPVLGGVSGPSLVAGRYYWLVVNASSGGIAISWEHGGTNQAIEAVPYAYGSFPSTISFEGGGIYLDRAYAIYCTIDGQSFGDENVGVNGHSFNNMINGSKYLCPASGTPDSISVSVLGGGFGVTDVHIMAAIYDSDLHLVSNGVTEEARIDSIGYGEYMWVNLGFPAPHFVPRTDLLQLLALFTFVAVAVVWGQEEKR